jgi:hypothetical protein
MSRCVILIYRSRKKKERQKIMVRAMVKQNLKINGNKKKNSILWGEK